MCSSPTSSAPVRTKKSPIKPFGEGLTSKQGKQFAEVANRADERSEQRRITQRRWEKNRL